MIHPGIIQKKYIRTPKGYSLKNPMEISIIKPRFPSSVPKDKINDPIKSIAHTVNSKETTTANNSK